MDQQTSTKRVKLSEEVEKLEKELNYWKNRCEFFESKYKELNDLINGGDYDVIVEKKPEIEHVEVKTSSVKELIQLATESPNKIFSFSIEDDDYNYYNISTKSYLSELPNIRKIVVKVCNSKWDTFFRNCQFPNIEELWLDCEYEDDHDGYNEEGWFKEISLGMKNLKHLFVDGPIIPYNYEYEYTREYKLESVYIGEKVYDPLRFVRGQESTLKSLKIVNYIYMVDFSGYGTSSLPYIYKNFKCLERLTVIVNLYNSGEAKVPVNNSISILDIKIFYGSCGETVDLLKSLKEILIASPAVKILILYEKMTSHLIQFIAANMKKLKMLICRGEVEDGILEKFAEMQKVEAGNANVNTKFSIKIEEGHTLTPRIRDAQDLKFFTNTYDFDSE